MFCPNCKAEYREGFTTCGECGVKLVDGLDEEVPTPIGGGPSDDLQAVFETKDSPLMNEIAGIVESKNIPYLVQSGTALRSIEGEALEWHSVLFVPSESVEDARAVIHEVQLGKLPIDEAEKSE
jgi:hypothetical protein